MRAFLATAELGSLSAAARALGATQPTLSRQVAALEQHLGLLLFERQGKSLQLTEAGRRLLVHVTNMGAAASSISMAASGEANSVSGLVRITASDLVAAQILPAVLLKLHQTVPTISVEVIATNAISDLMRREADIAIRHVRPTQPSLIARRCRDTTAHLYASKDYIRKHGRPTSPKDLAHSSFVGYSDAGQLIPELNARGIPVTDDNFRWKANNIVAAWELVKAGLGIGVIFKEVGELEPSVEQLLPHIEPFPAQTWLVTHREVQGSRRIRIVYDLLYDHFSGNPGEQALSQP